MSVELLRVDASRTRVAVLRYHARRPRHVSLVAAHGYSSSKHNLDALCGFLSSHGFDVFSLDFPGHKLGASGGTLRGFDDCIDALASVVAHVRSSSGAPIYTLGHSLGAMTALLTAALDPAVLGAIAIATGYGRPSALGALTKAGVADFRSSYVDGASLQEIVADVDLRFDRTLPLLAGRPALYVAASRDAMVNQTSVRELYDRAPAPKSFVTIDSDHTLAAEHARGEVLQWLNGLHARA